MPRCVPLPHITGSNTLRCPIPLYQAYAMYRGQSRRSARRRIGFELTFDEWLTLWLDSGQLLNRGTHAGGYVMARYGDKGPYAVGNVRIITQAENIAEYVATPETRAKIGRLKKGNKYCLGRRHSEETKRRIAESHKGLRYNFGHTFNVGRKHTEAHKAAIGESMLGNQHAKGYRHTTEAKARIGAASKGKTVSGATREKLRERSSGRKFSAASRLKMAESARRVWERKKEQKVAL